MKVLDWGIPLGIILVAFMWFAGHNAATNPVADNLRDAAKISINSPRGDAQAEKDAKQREINAALAELAWSNQTSSVLYTVLPGECGVTMGVTVTGINAATSEASTFQSLKVWVCGATPDQINTDLKEMGEELARWEQQNFIDPQWTVGFKEFLLNFRWNLLMRFLNLLAGG